MSLHTRVKICGITESGDAEVAHNLGAEWLGFNFYAESPRAVTWETARAIRADIPDAKSVYLQVRPDLDELRAAVSEGFDRYQLHFSVTEDPAVIESWAHIVTPARLWLAPRMRPEDEFPPALTELAHGFLLDAYHKDQYGGTGLVSDWSRFRALAHRYPEKDWILAGGLKPENITEAVAETGTRIVDLNSGVEIRPGRKSDARMKEAFLKLREYDRRNPA